MPGPFGARLRIQGDDLKTLAALAGTAGLVVVATLASRSQAAAPADPMADIADVYAWMTGSNLNLVMTVSTADDGSHSFGPGVAYVFHLTSKEGAGVGVAGGSETQVVCQFSDAARVQCWVKDAAGVKDYVDGDPSGSAGVASRRGKARVFAGRRSDPAFWFTAGYQDVITKFNALNAASHGASDGASCPAWLDSVNANALISAFSNNNNPTDTYAGGNVMALVVQVDRGLVNADSNTVVGVWGATHAAP